MPADDDVRTDEVSQQTIEGAARAKRAGGSTSKRLKTGPGPSTTDLHARAGPLSSMNALRSFADLDASQHPRLASLKRYDGVSLGGDLPLLSPGAAYGGARVAFVVGFEFRGGGLRFASRVESEGAAGGSLCFF